MALRPRLHFTARQHWLNDPNGLVFVNGVYHLFFQHNPLANKHGFLSWGHAISRDLLHWQELEVALPWRERHEVYSGCAFVDWHNTAQFARPGDTFPPVVAMYTGAGHYWQAQYLAVSRDAGQTWAFADDQPVLDEGKPDFRDPKTFWHADSGRWISVVVHPNERQIGVYGSPNLHAWQSLSTFGPAGEVAGIWEVPDLFPLSVGPETLWVMKVDVFAGGPQGGPGAQYWVGDFDGTTFVARQAARWADFGKDFYAAVTYSDLPSNDARTIWLAWMNSWDYANQFPTEPWRGAMTLPRELNLQPDVDGYALVQIPIRELDGLRLERSALEPGKLWTFAEGTPIDVRLTVPQGSALQLTLSSAAGAEAVVSIIDQQLTVNRKNGGPLEGFAGRHTAHLPTPESDVEVQLIVDTCSLEIFVGGGLLSLTDLLLPKQPLSGLLLSGDPPVDAEVWTLQAPLGHLAPIP